MKIIFMGTPEFAVPSINAVVAAGHQAAGVFTQPDKPKGRGMQMTAPPVKVIAEQMGLPVYQPASVKDEETISLIESIKADCIVVVAYGKLLPPRVLRAAKFGCVNVHSSLLPRYRGAAPINWAVINGDSETGVSTMLLDEGMDTGDILLQRSTGIGENETAGELHDRLALMGADLLVETLAGLEAGIIEPVKQDESLASYAKMLDRSLSRIDWNDSARDVHNKIRGLCPWPTAVTTIGGKRLKLHASRVAEGSGYPGKVISVSPLTVACGEGAIEIVELQGEGGKRMSSTDYMRGHPIATGEMLE